MKKLVLIIILFFAAQILYAQPEMKIEANTIDIREMVNKQIEEIRTAEAKEENRLEADESELKISSAETETEVANESGSQVKTYSRESMLSGIDSSLVRIFVLIEASLLAAMVLVYRRRKISAKPEKANLKENIMKLRDDKIEGSNDEKLAQLRKSLKNQRLEVKNMGRSITKKAKKLSVSKGEVHLAAKLNILAGSNR